MPKSWNGVMATLSTPSRSEVMQAERESGYVPSLENMYPPGSTITFPNEGGAMKASGNYQFPANDYPTRTAEATYVTTSPATYRFVDGKLLPNEAAPAAVSNPVREEITAQDIINKYYNLAKQSTAARTNDPYAVAKSLAARDGYNLDQLVRNRQAIIGR